MFKSAPTKRPFQAILTHDITNSRVFSPPEPLISLPLNSYWEGTTGGLSLLGICKTKQSTPFAAILHKPIQLREIGSHALMAGMGLASSGAAFGATQNGCDESAWTRVGALAIMAGGIVALNKLQDSSAYESIMNAISNKREMVQMHWQDFRYQRKLNQDLFHGNKSQRTEAIDNLAHQRTPKAIALLEKAFFKLTETSDLLQVIAHLHDIARDHKASGKNEAQSCLEKLKSHDVCINLVSQSISLKDLDIQKVKGLCALTALIPNLPIIRYKILKALSIHAIILAGSTQEIRASVALTLARTIFDEHNSYKKIEYMNLIAPFSDREAANALFQTIMVSENTHIQMEAAKLARKYPKKDMMAYLAVIIFCKEMPFQVRQHALQTILDFNWDSVDYALKLPNGLDSEQDLLLKIHDPDLTLEAKTLITAQINNGSNVLLFFRPKA